MEASATPRHVKALQYGEGNFLRAFADWMIDIANSAGVIDCKVGVVTPRFRQNKQIESLQKQHGCYHTVLEGIDHSAPKREIREIRCIEQAFAPEADYESYEKWVCDPELRFVISNTTEAGIRYEKDDASAKFPATFPGKIASMLHLRWRHFNGDSGKGLIFLPCELIEDNGKRLKEIVLRQSREAGFEPEFEKWIEGNCVFCDTLVDRIVSGSPKEPVEGIEGDEMAVVGEFYHLWVIGGEDNEKVKEEFPLDKAGLHVVFAPTVKEFRDKKVRILNGSHTAMVPVAMQLGCTTVLEAFSNDKVRRFINEMVSDEVIPCIHEDPAQLQLFADGILERFFNPYIKHQLESISLNSLSKWEARNWCSAIDYWALRHELPRHILFSFAALMWLYGPESGFSPKDNQQHIDIIRNNWNSDDFESMVRKVTGSGIFSVDFDEQMPGFSKLVGEYMTSIREKGMEQALIDYFNNVNG